METGYALCGRIFEDRDPMDTTRLIIGRDTRSQHYWYRELLLIISLCWSDGRSHTH